MSIKRVALSWVGVKDLKRSKDFFSKTLGLKVFEDQPEYGWVEFCGPDGGMSLGVGLSSPETQMPAGVNAIVTLVSDSYDATKKELAKKGVHLFGEVAVPNVPRMVCFKDPDGNTFQLVEETPGHTDQVR